MRTSARLLLGLFNLSTKAETDAMISRFVKTTKFLGCPPTHHYILILPLLLLLLPPPPLLRCVTSNT
jgi:hypothetical protein